MDSGRQNSKDFIADCQAGGSKTQPFRPGQRGRRVSLFFRAGGGPAGADDRGIDQPQVAVDEPRLVEP